MKNILKEKLKAGKQTLGLFMSIPSPIVTEALSRVGYDWFVFDNEHSPLDVASTQTLMQAMGGTDTVPLVRVPWNDIVHIKKTLDIGAYGLIIPLVNSKEEAKQAVSYCKYPSSKGIRGFGPRRASMLDREYVKTADDELLILVQIETQKAVNNVEEILSVEGIDGYYIGPNDLSFSLGILRDFENPKFKKTIDKVVEAGKNAGVFSGIHGAGLDNVKQRMNEGFQLICVGSDLGFVRRGAQSALQYLGKTK
jgi:2-keto-3-deoxy-L-rhamnonate aldolase RhmA